MSAALVWPVMGVLLLLLGGVSLATATALRWQHQAFGRPLLFGVAGAGAGLLLLLVVR
jgi:hypothetical protein